MSVHTCLHTYIRACIQIGVITGTQQYPVYLYNIFLGDFNPTTVYLMNFFATYIRSTPWFGTLTSYYNMPNSGKSPVSVSTETYFGANLTFSVPDIRRTVPTSKLIG